MKLLTIVGVYIFLFNILSTNARVAREISYENTVRAMNRNSEILRSVLEEVSSERINSTVHRYWFDWLPYVRAVIIRNDSYFFLDCKPDEDVLKLDYNSRGAVIGDCINELKAKTEGFFENDCYMLFSSMMAILGQIHRNASVLLIGIEESRQHLENCFIEEYEYAWKEECAIRVRDDLDSQYTAKLLPLKQKIDEFSHKYSNATLQIVSCTRNEVSDFPLERWQRHYNNQLGGGVLKKCIRPKLLTDNEP